MNSTISETTENNTDSQVDQSSEDVASLEVLKNFFNTWQYPPGSEQLQQAILHLVQAFEKCITEKRSSALATPSVATSNPPEVNTHYDTDEEELEQETHWTLQERRRPTKNQEGKKQPLVKKPPPIYVEKPGKISNLTTLINLEVEADSYTTKTVDKNKIKINLEDEASYRKTIQVLQREKLMFHTYENKQTRPIRVMAKGLDYTTEPDEIIDYLKRKGYKIVRVDSKLSARDKKPLNMFILSFDNSESIDSIHKIKEILRQIVEICPMKGSRLIPQCKNCQEFGHTKNHCNKKPRCVKCAQNHLTAQCSKPKEARPKCANCSGDHPASYRGCMVARELQKRRNNQITGSNNRASNPYKISTYHSSVTKPTQNLNDAPKRGQQRSYAQVVNSQNNQNAFQQIMEGLKELKIEMLNLKDRVERIETRSKPGPKPKKQ